MECEELWPLVHESTKMNGLNSLPLILANLKDAYKYFEELEKPNAIEKALYLEARDLKTENFSRYVHRCQMELR